MNHNESGVSFFLSFFQNCMHGVNLIFIYSKCEKWLIFFLDVATCKVSLTQIKMTLEIPLKYFLTALYIVKKHKAVVCRQVACFEKAKKMYCTI